MPNLDIEGEKLLRDLEPAAAGETERPLEHAGRPD